MSEEVHKNLAEVISRVLVVISIVAGEKTWHLGKIYIQTKLKKLFLIVFAEHNQTRWMCQKSHIKSRTKQQYEIIENQDNSKRNCCYPMRMISLQLSFKNGLSSHQALAIINNSIIETSNQNIKSI